MQTAQQKLQELLQQLFRADNADLDFGIYRIINYRRDQIQNFIDEKLPAIINTALDANTEAESEREELEDLANRVKEAFGDDVLDADGELIDETIRTRPLVNEYLEVKETFGSPQSRYQRADAIFNHLYTFFSRYYEDGDFIPRRRYSQTERYAIPYNGEEVYLHWANRDQYYVKSSEHFSAYRFKSRGITVTFDLRDIDVEKDNVQGTKRFFIPLDAETTYSSETDEISIPFEYRPLTDEEKERYNKQNKQDQINGIAETQILQHVSSDYRAYAALERRIDQITVLKKHLDIYARRNTADFFIHKDLKQFLNRELDAYIKNEVIPLSDFILMDENLGWLETAQLVHRIATQIIDFLSQIEEFQKCLWLKKKFVLSTDYCLTLDRVPEELYSEIIQNTAQREEWKHLFAIHEIDGDLVDSAYDEPLSVAFLKENPNLVLDTRHFDAGFMDRLLAHFENLDNETDGLLIHGENFQGLNLLKEKYRESVKAIYIDPPYNTKGSDFLYKDQYKHASWMSLMADRIALTHEILSPDGVIFISIDDNEQHHLRTLMDEIFQEPNFVAQFSWMRTATSPFLSKTVRRKMEPLICYRKSVDKRLNLFGGYTEGGDMPLLNESNAVRELEFPKDAFCRVNLQDGIYNAQRYGRIKLVKEIKVKNEQFLSNLIMEGRFKWTQETVNREIEDGTLFHIKSEKFSIRYERKGQQQAKVPSNLIAQNECQVGTNEEADTELEKILGRNDFNYPKPTSLIKYLINMVCNKNDILLDFFAGSGTTAHAVINLNRQDNGKRKYILVEMGHHFNTVLKPRVMKAVYAEKWRDAKPVRVGGVSNPDSRMSHIIKYQRIESYEDALNNIEFSERENSLFEDNLLSYLLGSKTCESPTFLNVAELQNPFNYQLNIVDGLQTHIRTVDLPETFNYLLGILVQTRQCFYDDDRRYLVYRGTVGQKIIVIIWRETKGWEEKDWERDYRFIEENKLTEGTSEVYVNTDSILPEAKSLDPLFKRLMFE